MRKREATLRQDVFTLRSVISQATLDKQKAPRSLQELLSAGYIRSIPKDPLTNETKWILGLSAFHHTQYGGEFFDKLLWQRQRSQLPQLRVGDPVWIGVRHAQ